MNCIIIDSNNETQKKLSVLLKEMPEIILRANCYSVQEALNALNEFNVDLVFLDVNLNGISGVEFARMLLYKPMIIITSFDGLSAADAFNINAIDFLIKPVTYERLLQAMQKVGILWGAIKYNRLPKPYPEKEKNIYDYIFVNIEHRTLKIVLDDILFIEGLKDYIKIHTNASKKPLVVRSSLKNIQESLPDNTFHRVHKSFIISLKHVSSIHKTQVNIGESYIPIGDSYRNIFLTSLSEKTV